MDIQSNMRPSPTAPASTSKPTPESKPPQPVERKLHDLPGKATEAVQGPRVVHTHAEVRFDKTINRMVGRIVNEQTGETIQELPPEQLKALYAKMREQLGPLVDETV